MSTYRFRWPGFLVLSIALHAVMIFLWNRSLVVVEPRSSIPITVTLQPTVEPFAKAGPIEPAPAPEPIETPRRNEPELVDVEEPIFQVVIPRPDTSTSTPAPSVQETGIARILSSQFNLETSGESPLSTLASIETEVPELGLAELPLTNSLRIPTPVQLPFEDTRMFLVDSYDAGLGGSVERFFDSVTVPFGWTTKGGLRVQCAWLMIIAGCSWGDKELFYRKAERRKVITQPH